MSGGSMDYLYSRVQEIAETGIRETTLLRKAFRAHLFKVAAALRSIEWNDSGDGDDEEDKHIKVCLQEWDTLRAAVKEAWAAKEQLDRALEGALDRLLEGET